MLMIDPEELLEPGHFEGESTAGVTRPPRRWAAAPNCRSAVRLPWAGDAAENPGELLDRGGEGRPHTGALSGAGVSQAGGLRVSRTRAPTSFSSALFTLISRPRGGISPAAVLDSVVFERSDPVAQVDRATAS